MYRNQWSNRPDSTLSHQADQVTELSSVLLFTSFLLVQERPVVWLWEMHGFVKGSVLFIFPIYVVIYMWPSSKSLINIF